MDFPFCSQTQEMSSVAMRKDSCLNSDLEGEKKSLSFTLVGISFVNVHANWRGQKRSMTECDSKGIWQEEMRQRQLLEKQGFSICVDRTPFKIINLSPSHHWGRPPTYVFKAASFLIKKIESVARWRGMSSHIPEINCTKEMMYTGNKCRVERKGWKSTVAYYRLASFHYILHFFVTIGMWGSLDRERSYKTENLSELGVKNPIPLNIRKTLLASIVKDVPMWPQWVFFGLLEFGHLSKSHIKNAAGNVCFCKELFLKLCSKTWCSF